MTYATRQDMEARFEADEIAKLADPLGDGSDRTAPALADAAAEMDGYLAVAYALPLPAGGWPLLTSIACDLARARLYDDAALDEPQARRKAAIMQLERLRDGELLLVSDAGDVMGRRNVAQRTGPDPVMIRDNLEGF